MSALGLIALAIAAPVAAQAPSVTRSLGPAPSNLLVPARLGGFASRAAAPSPARQDIVVLESRGWGTGFGVEAYGGTLKPRDGFRMPEQDFGGVLAGFLFGRDLALRGTTGGAGTGTPVMSPKSSPTAANSRWRFSGE